MEVMDPEHNTITLVTENLPSEVGDSTGLENAQLLTIGDGKELLLYGGNQVAKSLRSIEIVL